MCIVQGTERITVIIYVFNTPTKYTSIGYHLSPACFDTLRRLQEALLYTLNTIVAFLVT
jgi:hypothetical protein